MQTYFDYRVALELVVDNPVCPPLLQRVGWFSLVLAVLQTGGLLLCLWRPAALHRVQKLFLVSVFGPLLLAMMLTLIPPFYLLYLWTLVWKAPGILGIALYHSDLSRKDLVPA